MPFAYGAVDPGGSAGDGRGTAGADAPEKTEPISSRKSEIGSNPSGANVLLRPSNLQSGPSRTGSPISGVPDAELSDGPADLGLDGGDRDADGLAEGPERDGVVEPNDPIQRGLVGVRRIGPLDREDAEARVLAPGMVERVGVGGEPALEAPTEPQSRPRDRGKRNRCEDGRALDDLDRGVVQPALGVVATTSPRSSRRRRVPRSGRSARRPCWRASPGPPRRPASRRSCAGSTEPVSASHPRTRSGMRCPTVRLRAAPRSRRSRQPPRGTRHRSRRR